jgi:hypothetical protein
MTQGKLKGKPNWPTQRPQTTPRLGTLRSPRGLANQVATALYYQRRRNRLPNTGPIVPPIPPGPGQAIVTAVNGFDNLSIDYHSDTGDIIVGFAGLMNSPIQPTHTVTWKGQPLTLADSVKGGALGQPVIAFYYGKGLPTGDGQIVVAATTGSLGNGAIRIDDLTSLDDTPLGVSDGMLANQYYYEAVLDGRTLPSTYFTISCAVGYNGYPMTADGDMNEVWQTQVEGDRNVLAVAFRDSQRSLQYDNYFVTYPRETTFGGTMTVELKGASL